MKLLTTQCNIDEITQGQSAAVLKNLVEIALHAGEAILALQSSDIGTKTKTDGSPLTTADLVANEKILKGLAEKFVGFPVITEERVSDAAATNVRHVFLVDPLDGTKDFLSGIGEYTVNIALLDGPDPIAGVVYGPALGIIYAGALGSNARRASVKNGIIGEWEHIAATSPTGKLRAVISRSHPSRETQEYLEGLSVSELTPIGSSLKFCLIAAGEADIYPRMGRTMEWDTAAGDAILRAAGGAVLATDGTLLRYNKRDTAGSHDPANPWFVAAGRFNPFDPAWHTGRAAATSEFPPRK